MNLCKYRCDLQIYCMSIFMCIYIYDSYDFFDVNNLSKCICKFKNVVLIRGSNVHFLLLLWMDGCFPPRLLGRHRSPLGEQTNSMSSFIFVDITLHHEHGTSEMRCYFCTLPPLVLMWTMGAHKSSFFQQFGSLPTDRPWLLDNDKLKAFIRHSWNHFHTREWSGCPFLVAISILA